MNIYSQAHPEPAPERRRRALARPGFVDRREHTRYLAKFPVRVLIGAGKQQREITAHAIDIGIGGLCVIAPDLPPDEKRLRVEFTPPPGSMPEEYLHGRLRIGAEVRRRDADAGMVGLAFEETLAERLRRTSWGLLRWVALLVLLAATAFTILIKYENLYAFWFDVPVFLYSLLVGSYLLSRFLFAAFYRDSRQMPADADLPAITVIIPVRNEEEHIERTVRQVMESHYPADKLQLVIVDDCSADGTPQALVKARERYPETIVLRMDKPVGKRHAMATGVGVAGGDVLVFADSDSFVEPDALRWLVSRLKDPRVAAVTGHCDVENQWTNLLTRMQSVRYFVSFRVMKSAESVFGSVTCLSGPLAAYKRERLEEVMPGWLNQTFMGFPATFGDDRALTNALLRLGWEVLYESKARTTTIVPEDHRTFLRQQLRWKRSWFRESLIASSFMWRKEPLMALSFYLGFVLPILGPLIVLRALIYVPLVQQQWPLMYVGGVALMSAMMSSSYLVFKRSRLWIYGIPFCFYYMFVLVWQLPWAILTCRRSEWSTRS